MKFKRITLSVLFALIAGLFSGAYAQFQGHIEMTLYSYDKGKPVPELSTLNMYVTDSRIMFAGEEEFDLHQNMSAEGFLIRNDMKDFIVMVGDNQALQVTKKEIEELLDMFMSWGGDSGNKDYSKQKPNYHYSDRTRTINGLECAEMILENEENEGHLSVWLTPNININWGILAEPWKNLPKDIDEGTRVSQDVVFKGKSFPMLIEAVDKSGDVKTLMEVSSLNESSVAKAMVQVPSNITLVSAKEYIFKMMMNQ